MSDYPSGKYLVGLRDILRQRGLTQKALAEQLGVHTTTVLHWTQDSIPRGTILVKLSRFLGVSIDQLFGMATKRPIDAYTYFTMLEGLSALAARVTDLEAGLQRSRK